MATEQILAKRRDIAALVIERRAQGLARAFGIKLPDRPQVNYPDALHRNADNDEWIAAVLTTVLRAKDPKAQELKDPPVGIINETVTTYEPTETGVQHARYHSQPLRR